LSEKGKYIIQNSDEGSTKYDYATTGLIPVENNSIIRINKIGYPSWGDGVNFITWYSDDRHVAGYLR
jgi:hypothetical protein